MLLDLVPAPKAIPLVAKEVLYKNRRAEQPLLVLDVSPVAEQLREVSRGQMRSATSFEKQIISSRSVRSLSLPIYLSIYLFHPPPLSSSDSASSHVSYSQVKVDRI